MTIDSTTLPDWWLSPAGVRWRRAGATRPAVATPIPSDLAANLDHAIRISSKIDDLQAKIDALREPLRDSMAAAAVSAERWRDSGADPDEMDAIYESLKEAEIRGRGALTYILRRQHRTNHPAPPKGIPVVYVLLSAGEIVYVGRSTGVKGRVSGHRRDKVFDSVEIHVCRSLSEAADLEALLIDQHVPKYNRRRESRNGAAA